MIPSRKPASTTTTIIAIRMRRYRRSSRRPASGSGSVPPAMYGADSPRALAWVALGESYASGSAGRTGSSLRFGSAAPDCSALRPAPGPA
jgi:hypothetical protein